MRCHELGSLDFLMKMTEVVVVVVGRTVVWSVVSVRRHSWQPDYPGRKQADGCKPGDQYSRGPCGASLVTSEIAG